jgi:hypothetical protein
VRSGFEITTCIKQEPSASLAIRNGAKLIKPLLVVVCLALAVKLLADPANPLRTLIGV